MVRSRPELVAIYAQLRADCEAAGHALGQIFRAAPGLKLEALASG